MGWMGSCCVKPHRVRHIDVQLIQQGMPNITNLGLPVRFSVCMYGFLVVSYAK